MDTSTGVLLTHNLPPSFRPALSVAARRVVIVVPNLNRTDRINLYALMGNYRTDCSGAYAYFLFKEVRNAGERP